MVIPTLDEAERLPGLLEDLALLDVVREIVVADGGSTDGTREIAREAGVGVVRAPTGRGPQLNRGARSTDAPWLLFLHADTRMGARAREALGRWLRSAPPSAAAVFRFALEGDDPYWRFIEFGQRLRQRLYGLPYGDQGLVVSREAFEDAGGYLEIPIMEDVELVRRLRRGGSVETLPAPLHSSPRRYEAEGRLFGWLRNAGLITLYLVGVPAERLARWYRPRRTGDGNSRRRAQAGRTLLVFAKAPTPGRVKTRLAASVGERRAAEVYRRMGRRIVEEVAGGAYRVVVCHDPPDAGEAVRRWLGDAGGELELRPQARGGLGRRLSRAFAGAFDESAGAVCCIGTDAPGVDRALVEEAFGALEEHDAVLGPATDGGYYLVGLSRPAPALFRGIPWSTDRVLEATRRRITEEGLDAVELPPLTDVDTAEDLRNVAASLLTVEDRRHIPEER